MKNILQKIFFKPAISAKLLRGEKVKVNFVNATAENTMILLFTLVSRTAQYMGMSQRQMMNKLIDLDKTIVKSKKEMEREAIRQSHIAKHQK